MKKPQPAVRHHISVTPAQFVVIWQTAKRKADAVKKIGTIVRVADARAKYYRAHGVKLRYFRDPAQYDWKKLRELAAKIAPKKPGFSGRAS